MSMLKNRKKLIEEVLKHLNIVLEFEEADLAMIQAIVANDSNKALQKTTTE